MYGLYCVDIEHLNELKGEITISSFNPSPRYLFCDGEERNIRLGLSRLYFWVITAGNYMIFGARTKDGKLAHLSYVIPKCRKFSFMRQGDFEIGPCVTYESFRGMGIYPRVLSHIVYSLGKKENRFWMIVHEDNEASKIGVKKVGFEYCGEVYRTKYLKQYYKK